MEKRSLLKRRFMYEAIPMNIDFSKIAPEKQAKADEVLRKIKLPQ